MNDTSKPSSSRRHTREDSGLYLDADGHWWHDHEPISHPHILEAFNRGLRPTEDGRYRLDFGNDWCFVRVEDAAYRVLHLEPEASSRLVLHLTDRSQELLEPSTLRLDARGIFMCRVKEGRALARFTRDAQAALSPFLEEAQGRYWLVVRDTRSLLELTVDASG